MFCIKNSRLFELVVFPYLLIAFEHGAVAAAASEFYL
jgi:hypothetical protein